ncbi:MAG: SDR family oxidoreductase [Ktedonobacterales bacterium]
MALDTFTGAVAVITGGASGIGLATAEALYEQGAHVVLADINEQGLQQASQQIRERNPSSSAQVITVVTDVTDEGQVQELMRQAATVNQRIDLMVTSAGVGRGGLIDEFSAADMRNMMDINFMGTFHCVRAALPVMRQQQRGHFVFLSSVAGKLGAPLLSGDCATKWAVRGFSHALRTELYETGIDVTTVYPAWVDTPMVRQEGMEQLGGVEVLLTAEQVAGEILSAVREGLHDLTLAPNQDIAFIIDLMQRDPDQAEALSGQAFRQRLQGAEGR